MNTQLKRTLYWTPRILTVAFILFLGIFALDVFSEESSLGEILVGLFVHLIPNMVLALILWVTWRREWIGALLFTGLGIFYLVETWGRFHWSVYAAISGPLFLMGVLFLLNWILRDELRGRAEAT